VTHEPDIAQYAKRIIEFRDGKVRRDVQVVDRSIAAEVLPTLPLVGEDETSRRRPSLLFSPSHPALNCRPSLETKMAAYLQNAGLKGMSSSEISGPELGAALPPNLLRTAALVEVIHDADAPAAAPPPDSARERSAFYRAADDLGRRAFGIGLLIVHWRVWMRPSM